MGAQPMGSAVGWHSRTQLLERFIADLLCDELKRARPGSPPAAPQPWPPDFFLDEAGLGLDSIERLSAAAALTEALHLHEGGVEDLLLARRRFGEWVQVAHSGLVHFNEVMTFRTSGSSGVPKACSHPLALLRQETQYLATLFAGTRRIFFTVPGHHIYGFLFTVLLPEQLGATELIDARQLTAQVLQQRVSRGDLITSHPAHWSIVARTSVIIPPGVVGVTSTAPCPSALPAALAERGLSRLVQVYGSSETGGVGWRDSSQESYVLMPFWSRDTDDDTHLLRSAPDGSVRSYELQDRLTWEGVDRFTVLGRRDEVVQVGGVNVSPHQVRRKLLEHPHVVDAAVRLMDRNGCARLKAFIVPVPGLAVPDLQRELVLWTETHLRAPDRPKAFAFGPELPRNAQGKPSDWDLTDSIDTIEGG
jgi:4-coumarate--CoA ligase (photoactive yellow protein activation family)